MNSTLGIADVSAGIFLIGSQATGSAVVVLGVATIAGK